MIAGACFRDWSMEMVDGEGDKSIMTFLVGIEDGKLRVDYRDTVRIFYSSVG